MKIHEYQAKQIFKKYGVPIPKGTPVLSFNEVEAAAKELIAETENEFVVVKAQIHAGGRGKGGGVKVAKGAAAARDAAREDPRHAAGHPPDRAEGKKVQAPAGRAGGRHRARALPRHGRRSRHRARHGDGVDRRRHGDRGGRRQDAGEDPARGGRPGRSAWRRTRRASSPSASGCTARRRRTSTELLATALSRVRRDRLLAGRDQPAGRVTDGERARARRQDHLRRQRALPPQGVRGAARPRRGRSVGDRGQALRPQLHQARRQHRLHGQRRRPRDGDDGHHQALRRRAGELPRRRRRRHRGEGDRGVQDHHRRSQR